MFKKLIQIINDWMNTQYTNNDKDRYYNDAIDIIQTFVMHIREFLFMKYPNVWKELGNKKMSREAKRTIKVVDYEFIVFLWQIDYQIQIIQSYIARSEDEKKSIINEFYHELMVMKQINSLLSEDFTFEERDIQDGLFMIFQKANEIMKSYKNEKLRGLHDEISMVQDIRAKKSSTSSYLKDDVMSLNNTNEDKK